MALQVVKGKAGWFPPRPNHVASGTAWSFTTSALLLNAASEKAAFIFDIGKTGSIDKIHFRTATVTTGGDVDVRLETVDGATGFPTGTLYGANTNGALTIADANDNTAFAVSLTTDASVTEGDLVAIVIVNSPTIVGNFQIAALGATNAWGSEFPYCALEDAAVWAVATGTPVPVCTLEYSDGSFEPIPGAFWATALANTAFNTGSGSISRGNKFQVPFPVRVNSFWVWADLDGDATMKLYDENGTTVLLSKTMDKDVRGGTGYGRLSRRFPGTTDLKPNTYYRLVLEATSATSVTLPEFTVGANAQMDAHDLGQLCHLAHGASGSWTDVPTQRAMMGVGGSALDDGAGFIGGQQMYLMGQPRSRAVAY